MQNKTITFIGAGNMAHSLIHGLINDGFDPKKIWATNPSLDALQNLKPLNINTTQNNIDGAEQAEVIVFAVKPQVLKTVAGEIAEVIAEKKPLIISVAAGVREADLREWLGNDCAIVRCMPNTPALLRSGATGLYANSQVTSEQKNLAEAILRAVGITLWLDQEALLDTVTALSGSGPAYFFLIMEALEKVGMELGLPAETARLLTAQTALGAARMALESEHTVEELRKKVTSPGGTTERAIRVLENGQLKNLFAEAVQAAQQRAIELAEMFGK